MQKNYTCSLTPSSYKFTHEPMPHGIYGDTLLKFFGSPLNFIESTNMQNIMPIDPIFWLTKSIFNLFLA